MLRRIFSYVIILICSISLMFAQELHVTVKPTGGEPVGKIKRNIKSLEEEALTYSKNVRTYNIKKARASIEQAIDLVEDNDLSYPEVYWTAALVEDYAFNYERNRPALLGQNIKMDDVLQAASRCYGYCQKAYELIAIDPEQHHKLKGLGRKVQEKAMNYYLATKGFLVQANDSYQDGAMKGALFYFSRSADGGMSDMLCSLYEGKGGKKTYEKFAYYYADSTICKALYNCAVIATSLDSVRLAISYYNQLKDRHYDPRKVYANTISIYAQIRDTTSLIRELEQAMNDLPTEVAYPKQILQIYLDQNNWGRAERIGNIINKRFPNDIECIVLQGQLFERRGKLERALDYYMKAYEQDPLHESVCTYIGRIYMRRSQELYQTLYEQVLLDEIDRQVPPLQDKALRWFRNAYQLDLKHRDALIPVAMREILYKRFTDARCPNKDELIAEYNQVSRDYGYAPF